MRSLSGTSNVCVPQWWITLHAFQHLPCLREATVFKSILVILEELRWWLNKWNLNPLALAPNSDSQLTFKTNKWTNKQQTLNNQCNLSYYEALRQGVQKTLHNGHVQDVARVVTPSQPARGDTHQETSHQSSKSKCNKRAHINWKKGIPRAFRSGHQGDCTTENWRNPPTKGHLTKTGSQSRAIWEGETNKKRHLKRGDKEITSKWKERRNPQKKSQIKLR